MYDKPLVKLLLQLERANRPSVKAISENKYMPLYAMEYANEFVIPKNDV